MYRSQYAFEKAMRSILKTFLLGKDLPKNPSEDEMEALGECVDREYVTGIVTARTANGKLHAQGHERIYVTYAGLQFISNRYPNLRANIAIVISIASVVTSIIINLSS